MQGFLRVVTERECRPHGARTETPLLIDHLGQDRSLGGLACVKWDLYLSRAAAFSMPVLKLNVFSHFS